MFYTAKVRKCSTLATIFLQKNQFVPFFFPHPPSSHPLRFYSKGKIANLVRREYEPGIRKVRRKNNCSFFRFLLTAKQEIQLIHNTPFPLQEALTERIKKGYTLSPGWLHPFRQMATPFGAKGVAIPKE